ncbi:MAG: hypothetical protein PHD76_01910 [Methylacidiphilales bacterium]|nr:hypothetical protein [Candidatus Methylacidiphilales bacterium]
MAVGDVIGWVNSDDFYYPGTFHYIRHIFEQNPEIDVISGDYSFVDADGRIRSVHREVGFDRNVFLFAGKCYLANSAMFFRASLLKKHAGPREDLHYAMDYELYLRLSAEAHFLHARRILGCYRLHDDSKTVSALLQMQEETKRVQEEYLERFRATGDWMSNPLACRLMKPIAMARRILLKARGGCYFPKKPPAYALDFKRSAA